jgi:hypothetical protein
MRCPSSSSNWTSFSSPWARAWEGHEVVDLAGGRLALHYLEENLDEVNDKTVPRWHGEAARPTTTRMVDGRWRDQMRAKILELKSYGVTRYADVAQSLNTEGITTRLGHPRTPQSIYRLMRSIGLPTGKPGRRRRHE